MPITKLTKTEIDKLRHTPGKQVIYWDRELKGFGLIVGQNSKTFIAQLQLKKQGTAIRYTLDKYGHITPDQARERAKEVLSLLANGTDPRKDRALTLQKVFCKFLEHRSLKETSKRQYRSMMKNLDNWLDVPLEGITSDMVLDKHLKLSTDKDKGPYTANLTIRLLGILYRFAAIDQERDIPNPTTKLSRMKIWNKESRRSRYIKNHQLPIWWQAVQGLDNRTWADYFTLLLLTGLRRREAAKLTWENIDLEDKTLHIPDTKNNEPLTLPLSDYLVQLLKDRKPLCGNSLYVFPSSNGTSFLQGPERYLELINKASDIKFSCHDLRRAYVTHAGEITPVHALKRLINHSMNGDVTAGYNIISFDKLRQYQQRITNHILKLTGGSNTGEVIPIKKVSNG